MVAEFRRIVKGVSPVPSPSYRQASDSTRRLKRQRLRDFKLA